MSARFTTIRATYRLQFHPRFTFEDAARLVPYLARLGISHVYSSPIMEARPGSTHGYDIVDHNRINPEIGGEEGFQAFVAALKAHGMGLILDIVPNHVGIGGSNNEWWLDVLEWGAASPFAAYFDINWKASREDLKGRVLLPVLGDHYGAVLEAGEITLSFDPAEGSFSAWYYEHRFPISPKIYATILAFAGEPFADLAEGFLRGGRRKREWRTHAAELKRRLAERARDPAAAQALAAALAHFAGRPGDPASFRPLHRLLELQAYRIAYWRVAAEEINYRRFFNINDLAALRTQLPELFDKTHQRVFDLIARGDVDGLRVDHIDGLYDPRAYCKELRRRAGDALYLVVEKILARYEVLPDWPVAGTTGYDFLNQVLALFVDPEGEAAMTRIYRRLGGGSGSFDEVLYAAKERIMQVTLASEISVLADEFHRLSISEWRTRDFTLRGIRAALEEVVAAFPVYRTYVSRHGAGADDRRYIEWALAQARKRWAAPDLSIFEFLHGVLTAWLADPHRHARPDEVLRVAMHFQQVTGPVMAKSFEDTAFYRYFRLLALNEVGGDPRRFGMSVTAFHHLMQERLHTTPHGMVATATHDTKRGEDARLRLALLSEIPQEWERRVTRWMRLNRFRRIEIDDAAVPGRNIEYFFYQALLGAWPPGLAAADPDGIGDLAERMAAYMTKAVREGKEESSWSNPNTAYEAALERFVRGVLDASRSNPFLAEFEEFVGSLARSIAIASLAQLVLKLTVPGVPDIYQGGELWDFSLVDPDNRGRVDWELRMRLIDEVANATAADLAANWQDGREKLFVAVRLLGLRRRHSRLFAEGDYQPLEVSGDRSAHLCAFARSHGGERLVVAVPRLVYRLYQGGLAARWGDTVLVLPPQDCWREVFGARSFGPLDRIGAADLLAGFPVTVLLGLPG
ncbi:MAG TPA: malto-oligosyltrehalose synthase [Stellaceae bacterium]|nr:malto-oligosyltrehalose synthase [Stellaceae bacterium]